MIIEKVKEVEAKVIEYRRHFHDYPEISCEEFETLAFIKKELAAMGIPFQEIENGGILGYIGDQTKGKTVLLRGDIDALPIDECENNLAGPKNSVSQNPGVSHACGHDGHAAMLLGAAKVLKGIEDQLEGRVILCFEQGEEGANLVQNIIKYIQGHQINIDFCYGMHLRHCLESGKMSANVGPVMAGIFVFDVTLVGKGGHGSRPDLSINPIDCFSKIYLEMNAARMNRISPFEPLTFSVGKLQAGGKRNVIPGELTFGGSVRYFNTEIGIAFKEDILEIIENMAKTCRCEVVYNRLSDIFPSVVNDAKYSKFVQDTIVKYNGAETLVEDEAWMGSETFSVYSKIAPSVFAFVGIENEELGTGANHHTPEFDVDEAVLIKGVMAHVAVAYEFLNGKAGE